MPWGDLSAIKINPNESNDGPILWCRPGEQLVPTVDSRSPLKRKRFFFPIFFLVVTYFCIPFSQNWNKRAKKSSVLTTFI